MNRPSGDDRAAGGDNCPHCGHEAKDSWLSCAWCGEQLAVAAELAKGTRVGDGRYQILGVLGRGGFGITYDVGDRRLQRRVAMKELFPESAVRHGSMVLTPPQGRAGFKAARERFLREARVLARFTHPGIVRVYEVFEEHGTAYLVMELLQGRTLVDLLHERGEPFPEAELLDVAGRVAAALRPVHAAGVLHRDVNPSNTMMTHHGRIVVIDFGLARDYDEAETVGMTRVVTPGYAPLEQYRGTGRFGPSTDVYGLAATLYRLATGRVPTSAVERDAGGHLQSVHSLNPAISKAVSDAILDGLELEPAHRPQDLDSFLARLGVAGLPQNPRSMLLDMLPPPSSVPDRPDDSAPAFDPKPKPTPRPDRGVVPAAVPNPASPAAAAPSPTPNPGSWSPKGPTPPAPVPARPVPPPGGPTFSATAVAPPVGDGGQPGVKPTQVAGAHGEPTQPGGLGAPPPGPPDGTHTAVLDPHAPRGFVGNDYTNPGHHVPPAFAPPRPAGPPAGLGYLDRRRSAHGAAAHLVAAERQSPKARRSVIIPLVVMAAALGAAAPVLGSLVVALIATPLVATIGDGLGQRRRNKHGIQPSWAEQNFPSGFLAAPRFLRNVGVSALRSLPVLGVSAILLVGWYGIKRVNANPVVLDAYLRLLGAGSVISLLTIGNSGSRRFRAELGVEQLTAWLRPNGKIGEVIVVFWIVTIGITAAALWLDPTPFPFPGV